MDRNSITAVLLMSLLVMVWFIFFAPEPNQPPTETNTTSTTTEAPAETAPADAESDPEETLLPAESDSSRQAELFDRFSDFAGAAQGESEEIEVKTDQLTVTLDTKGGKIKSVYLNGYKTYDSLPLPAIAPIPGNALNFQFDYNNRAIGSADLFFQPVGNFNRQVSGEDSVQVTLRAAIDNQRYIDQTYTFYGDRFDVGYSIQMKGLSEGMVNSFYELVWKNHLPKTELSIDAQRQKSQVVYKVGGDIEKLSISDDYEEEKLMTPVQWVSFKSQFFSSILMPNQPFRSGSLTMQTPATEQISRIMNAKMIVDLDRSKENVRRFDFYFGPNEYYTLNSYKRDLEKTMDLGWFFIRWINVGTTYIFKFLENYVSNYGLIIIILGVFIRLLISPLTYKSHVSMAKMKVINQTPEMKAIDEKYKDDPQKQQMAKMGVYREMGVSMFGGCLPMLLSYPFLIALFFFFPQSVELRQQSFLWANDLSAYDSVLQLPFEIPFYGDHVSLFCLLMALSTFFFTYFQQQSQPATGAQAQMKFIVYLMPVFLLVFLNNYASGLSLYYLTSNLLSIAQTLGIRAVVNDEKLLAQMREAQKKKKKKGKGGKGGKGTASKSRLESWIEKQQKKQEQAMKARRKGQPGAGRRDRRGKK